MLVTVRLPPHGFQTLSDIGNSEVRTAADSAHWDRSPICHPLPQQKGIFRFTVEIRTVLPLSFCHAVAHGILRHRLQRQGRECGNFGLNVVFYMQPFPKPPLLQQKIVPRLLKLLCKRIVSFMPRDPVSRAKTLKTARWPVPPPALCRGNRSGIAASAL